jgi:hypothetical protein
MALSAEFGADVSFSGAPPSTFTAPSVVVVPDETFLSPETHGLVKESWEVLVVVSLKDPAKGIEQMRQISLRVMRAAHSVGAVWRSATGPFVVGGDTNKSLVASKNKVDFKYPPVDHLPGEESE